MPLTLLALATVLLVASLTGYAFQRIGQPRVIGEIVGGILLGPTLLGALPLDLSARLFPKSAQSGIGAIGAVAIAAYMFTIGLRLDLPLIAAKRRLVLSVSAASLILPFIVAVPLALLTYPANSRVDGAVIRELPFVLFLGTAFAVTALPVLVRILEDRRLTLSPIGQLATACAVIQDTAGWVLLAVVLAVARASKGGGLFETLGGGIALVVVAFALARPLLLSGALHARQRPERSPFLLVVLLGFIVLWAASSDAIGLSPAFGGLIFGFACGHGNSQLCTYLVDKLSPLARMLLPAYFLAPGLTVNLRAIGVSGALFVALMLLVASLGKVGGVTLAARHNKLTWKHSAMLGALMNTRGLVELVVLQAGYTAGLLGPRLFTELVAMAIATTLATGPLLNLLARVRTVGPVATAPVPGALRLGSD